MSSSSGVGVGNGAGVGDAVTAELTAMLARLAELADTPVDDQKVAGAVRIDRIAVLEHLRSALAAAQHTEMVGFGRSQVAEQAELIREIPGWQIETVHDGLGDQPHTAQTTTPTGHTYTSRAGP